MKKSHVILTLLTVLFVLVSISAISASDINDSSSSTIQDTADTTISTDSSDTSDYTSTQDTSVAKTSDSTSSASVSDSSISKSDSNLASKTSDTPSSINSNDNSKDTQKNLKESTTNEITSQDTTVSSKDTGSDDSEIYDNSKDLSLDSDDSSSAISDSDTTKIGPDVKLSSDSFMAGQNVTFTATLPSDATGNAVFKINDKTVSEQISVDSDTLSYSYYVPASYTNPTYKVTFVYSGNSVYDSARVDLNVSLDPSPKREAQIELSDLYIVPGMETTFAATFPSDATGSIVFKVNDKTVSDKISINSTTMTYNYLIPENYTNPTYKLTVVYSGNNGYSQTTVSTNISLSETGKREPYITVTGEDLTIGKISDFVATVPSDATGSIIFQINGNDISDEIEIESTTITYPFSVNSTYKDPSYTLSVVYSGDETYDENTVETTIYTNNTDNSTKIEPDLRVLDNQITPGEDVTFVAVLPDDATGSLVFKINSKTISNTIIVDSSMITYDYTIPSDFKSSTYTLTAVYSGDEKYYASSVSVTLTLTPAELRDPEISLGNFTVKYNQEVTLKATLANNATGNAVFKLNGTTVTPKVSASNGEVVYVFNASYKPGTYRLQIVYSGNFEYTNSSLIAYLTIEKLESKVVVSNITSKAGSYTTFKARVQDELGNPVTNTLVVFKINGCTIGNATTNETGHAFFNYTLPSSYNNQQYTITAKTSPTTYIADTSQNATLNLTQLKTRLEIPSISANINSTVTLTATVIDENGNNVLKGTVEFYIDGKKVYTADVENGYALYIFVPDTNIAKSFKVSAYYTGYWKYGNSSGSGTIETTKIGTVTTTRYVEAKNGISTVLSASVKDKNQLNVNGGYVEFTVNGTYVGKVEVKNGAANLTITLSGYPEGEYRLNATYLGSDSYLESDNLNYVNISTTEVTISGSPVYVTVGDVANITVRFTDETGHYLTSGRVNFRVNGTDIGNKTIVNGSASIMYRPPNSYSGYTVLYVVTLEETDYYSSASMINNFTVSPLSNVYVSSSGSDSNTGSYAQPFKTLSYAVGHVATYGTVNLLAETYYASGLLLNSSISIVGSGSKTIIDGGGSGSPVFRLTETNILINIKNLVIRNGKSTEDRMAGAIYSAGRLNITNVQFINNTGTGAFSGGAIYSAGLMNLTNVSFTNNTVNTANAEGGAVRLINNTTNMNNVNFTGNTAKGTNDTGGGAIYMQDGDLIIDNARFDSNKATGKTVLGGAIKGSYGDMVITNSKFTNNQVNGTDYGLGGAISSLATGIYINASSFSSNKVYGSSTASGGVLYVQYAAIEIHYTNMTSNLVKAKDALGGAVYGYNAYINITDSKFSSNNVTATSGSAFGGAIYQEVGNLTIYKSEFTSNTANSTNVTIGGAIYVNCNFTANHTDFTSNKVTGSSIGGGAIGSIGNLTVTNSNFVSNNASNNADDITSVTSAKNNVDNNYWGAKSPTWSNLLTGITTPSKYSTTKISH